MPVCIFAFLCNLTLFFLKLYVGLSSNSISIYSDGVNNMFDGISAVITAASMGFLARRMLVGSKALMRKTEELLSLILSALVLFSGAYFAYTSLERLIYPTPIWFSMKYLYILIGTALFKLVMYFIYRSANRKMESDVVKIMTYDCLLDFFITSVTVVSLAVSGRGTFSLDAFCGIFISTVIIVGAVKMLVIYLKRVVGYVAYESREEIEAVFSQKGVDKEKTDITFIYGEEIIGLVSYEDCETREKAESLYAKIKEATDITLKTVNISKGEK